MPREIGEKWTTFPLAQSISLKSDRFLASWPARNDFFATSQATAGRATGASRTGRLVIAAMPASAISAYHIQE